MSNVPVQLASIERRIQFHIQGVYANVLEVGRCLIEAKESGLVPRGEWEAWVNRVAGMGERTAQRLMQAAREVEPGSALSQLPLTKIQAILALPAGEREPMAARARDEEMTLRQLQDAVATERRRSEQLREKYNTAVRGNTDRAQQISRLQNSLEILRAQYDDERRQLDRDHRRELGLLRQQLEDARATAAGISPEAQAEIDRLQRALSDAEAQADRQAELRQQAQQALVELKSSQARGERAAAQEDTTADAVTLAVRTFVATVGYVPHSARVMAFSERDRQLVASHVELIGEWVDAMRAAVTTVVIEGA